MPAKFVVVKSGKGFHWNLLATNGKVIASGEHYKTRRAAMAGIESVKKNASGAPVVEGDEVPPKLAAAKATATRVGMGVAKTVADKATSTRVGKGVAKTVADKVAAIKHT
jgi:uncharacterized protein YegP (UPF0339 family)